MGTVRIEYDGPKPTEYASDRVYSWEEMTKRPGLYTTVDAILTESPDLISTGDDFAPVLYFTGQEIRLATDYWEKEQFRELKGRATIVVGE